MGRILPILTPLLSQVKPETLTVLIERNWKLEELLSTSLLPTANPSSQILHLRQNKSSEWQMDVRGLASVCCEHRTQVSEDISKCFLRGRLGAAML